MLPEAEPDMRVADGGRERQPGTGAGTALDLDPTWS